MNDQKPKFTFVKFVKIFILACLMVPALLLGSLGGITVQIARTAPKVNPSSINALLNENSIILDQNGNVLEKIQTEEFRTIIPLSEMPKYLQEAFISVEDERFRSHIGVDLQGIGKSILDNIQAGAIVRGASTITQQLARNLYLTGDQNVERKIREAYIALQLNQALSKDQILEAYMNRVYVGQGAYGVEAGAETYFSKSAKDLTLGEAAALAATVKSPTNFALYKLYLPGQEEGERVVGEVDEYGEKYIAVYNPVPEKRRIYVLDKMLELGKITKEEHDKAVAEDMAAALRPQRKRIDNLSTYYTDLVKTQVVEKLMSEKNLSQKDAEHLLYDGGLRIHACVDVEMQRKLEDVFNNFTDYLNGNNGQSPVPFIQWTVDGAKNIIGQDQSILFYAAENLFDENGNLVIPANSFNENENGLSITVPYLKIYSNKSTDIADYYTTNENKNLVTHSVGGLQIESAYLEAVEGGLNISKEFLNSNKEFYSISEDGTLKISKNYFDPDKKGTVQPQSAAVIMDYHTGEIKAIIGGREQEGFRIFNRATSPRQPGSTLKPIATFTAALDNGYTAATPIDDVPFYNKEGKVWPENWYGGYRGIMTVREVLRMSGNVATVKTLDKIGVDKAIEYLRRYHIIETDHPENDDFIEKTEDPAVNDENLAAIGLGAMTHGISPLRMTAAYSAIANNGVYNEPITFTKVEDSNGEILLEHPQKKDVVVSPQVAYILKNILQTVAKEGTIGLAKLGAMDIAGKTGTTEDTADVWFIGFTPYYCTGVWIGNDNLKVNLLSKSNLTAISLWRTVMEKAHEGLEAKNFTEPEGIIRIAVDTVSGKLPSALSYKDPRGTVREEVFVAGTEPKTMDDVHFEVEIDSTLKKLASEFTPEIFKEKKVYVRFPEPYHPELNNGIVPGDWEYRSVPTEKATAEDYVLFDLLNEKERIEKLLQGQDPKLIEKYLEYLNKKNTGTP